LRKYPVKFVSITSSQSSCFNLGKILSFVIPALLIKISIDENSFSTDSKHCSTDSWLVTSMLTAIAFPPASLINVTTSSAFSLEEEYPTATLHVCPSFSAIALPIPLEPPVTKTVLIIEFLFSREQNSR
jgi:hypothetical protein